MISKMCIQYMTYISGTNSFLFKGDKLPTHLLFITFEYFNSIKKFLNAKLSR